MVLRACAEQEGRTCTTRKTSRTIDSEIDYGLSRLANGKLRQGKAKSGNKQKPIHHNRSTNPKAKQYIAPHPKPIQSLKMSYSSHESYTSHLQWQSAKLHSCLFRHCAIATEKMAILVNGITRQIYPVIPDDACAA